MTQIILAPILLHFKPFPDWLYLPMLILWHCNSMHLQRYLPMGIFNRCKNFEELHSSFCLRNIKEILLDPSHPGHVLFERPPSGRRFRSINTKPNRLRNSFYPSASPWWTLLSYSIFLMFIVLQHSHSLNSSKWALVQYGNNCVCCL